MSTAFSLPELAYTDPSNDQHKPNSIEASTVYEHDRKDSRTSHEYDLEDVHTKFEDAEAGAVIDEHQKEKTKDGWETDEANPQNWGAGRRWRMTGVVAAYTFVRYAYR